MKSTDYQDLFKYRIILKSMEAIKSPLSNKIWKVSNPKLAQERLRKYIGKDAVLYLSERKDKKYFVLDPEGRKVHFGNTNYEDFLKHGNPVRRNSYIKRASNIRGEWKDNKYSPNNLAIHVLW